MEITTLTVDQLQLKEDSGSFGIGLGIVLVVAGAAFGFFVDKSQFIGLGFAIVIALVGIYLIFASSSDTLSANKQSGQLSYQEKRITGTKESMHAISDVARIEIHWNWQTETSKDTSSSDSDGEERTVEETFYVASSVLIFNDGKKIDLIYGKKTPADLAEKEIIAGTGVVKVLSGKVAQFLNVPVQEVKG